MGLPVGHRGLILCIDWSGLGGKQTDTCNNEHLQQRADSRLARTIAMAGKKGDNSKKVVGNARKAEAAAQKSAADEARQEDAEADKWQKGAKSSAKK